MNTATESPPKSARSLATLPGPKGWPVVGNLPQLDPTRLPEALEAWGTRYGSLYALQLGPRRCVVVSDPALVDEVNRERPHRYRRFEAIREVLVELGADGVFAAEGDGWKKQRRLMAPAFASGALRAAWPDLQKITESLHDRLLAAADGGQPIEIVHEMMHYTVEVTARVLFGRELGSAGSFRQDVETVFAGMHRRINALVPYWRWFKLPTDRRLDRAMHGVVDEINAMIRTTQAELSSRAPGDEPRTLLEALLSAQDQDDAKGRFSESEVVGNAITLLLAGEDTTANTLAWFGYYMARYPQVLARLRSEVDAVLGPGNILPRWEDVTRLPYAGAVAREVLRLRSPAPFLFQQALVDVELGGVALPASTVVIVLTRRADFQALGDDAKDFRPERWPEAAAGTSQGLHDARGDRAFGGGPRLCPGRGMALVECALVFSMLAKSFDLTVVGEPQEHFAFVNRPAGLHLRLARRAGSHPTG